MKKFYVILTILLICTIGKTATDSNNMIVPDSNNTEVSDTNSIADWQVRIKKLEQAIKSQEKRFAKITNAFNNLKQQLDEQIKENERTKILLSKYTTGFSEGDTATDSNNTIVSDPNKTAVSDTNSIANCQVKIKKTDSNNIVVPDSNITAIPDTNTAVDCQTRIIKLEQVRKSQGKRLLKISNAFTNLKQQLDEQIKKNERTKILLSKYTTGFSEGDTVSIGYTSYIVGGSFWRTRLVRSYSEEKPNAMFLVVILAVRNDDTKPRSIPPFKLIDENGAEYETFSSAGFYFKEYAMDIFDSLNPSVLKKGCIAFDVPTNHNYKLKVSGGYWSKEDAIIRLSPEK
jgi:hypothetical protein